MLFISKVRRSPQEQFLAEPRASHQFPSAAMVNIRSFSIILCSMPGRLKAALGQNSERFYNEDSLYVFFKKSGITDLRLRRGSRR